MVPLQDYEGDFIDYADGVTAGNGGSFNPEVPGGTNAGFAHPRKRVKNEREDEPEELSIAEQMLR